MIAAYQRISRADGDLGKDGKDKSNSIENQKELILRYISCKESLQNVPVIFLTNQMNLCRTFNECLFFNKEHDGEGKVYRLLEN